MSQMQDNLTISPYHKGDGWKTRYWAVHIGEELLAVVVYKKGARAVVEKLRSLAGNGLATSLASTVAEPDPMGGEGQSDYPDVS